MTNSKSPKIGAIMLDGTVFAGISPATGMKMYATPADAPLTLTFDKAADYAAKLNAHGHNDWRLPAKNELNELFNNRAAIGGFSDHCYWSEADGSGVAWGLDFSGSDPHAFNAKILLASVRCVR